jgi:dTMP kinase
MAPDRTTPVGAVLDAYLTRATSLEPCAAHLLFAANRWERSGDLCAALQRGTHVVVDR